MNRKKHTDVLFVPSGSIGDALMMLALCDEMLAHMPQLRITVLVRKNAKLIGELAQKYPAIEVVETKKSFFGFIELLLMAIRRPYIILMPIPFWKGFGKGSFLFFTLVSLRPGIYVAGLLKKSGDVSGYAKAIVYDSAKTYIDNIRMLARAAGLAAATPGSGLRVDVPLSSPNHPPLPGSYFVLHFFGSSSLKSFPPRRARMLLDELVKQCPNTFFILTAAAPDAEAAHAIAAGLPRTSVVVEALILEVAWLIQHCKVYIGVDTGITHLAGVLGKKTVLLGHNASPTWMPTYNPNAIILTADKACLCGQHKGSAECVVEEGGKSYYRCLYDISQEDILEAITRLVIA